MITKMAVRYQKRNSGGARRLPYTVGMSRLQRVERWFYGSLAELLVLGVIMNLGGSRIGPAAWALIVVTSVLLATTRYLRS
jgi:hypothetical protein